MTKRFPYILPIIKICVAVGLLTWLFAGGKIDLKLLFQDKRALPGYLIGFAFMGTGWILQVYRWKRLGAGQGISMLFSEALKMTWASQFCALFLPGVMGAELVRGYYIAARNPMQRMAAVSTVVIDRGLGLYASLWLGVASGLFFFMTTRSGLPREVLIISLSLGLMLCGTHVGWQFIYSKRTFRFIKYLLQNKHVTRIVDAALAAKFTGREIRGGIALSLVSMGFSILAFSMIGRAISPEAGWLGFFIVCPLVYISLALPVSPGGIGVGETAAEYLFQLIGIQNGATMMLMFRILNILMLLPGAFLLIQDHVQVKADSKS